MSQKILSILLRGEDQVSPATKRAAASAKAMADSFTRNLAASARMTTMLTRGLLSAKTAMLGLGAAAGAGVAVAGINRAVSRLDELAERARQLGLDTTTAQVLEFVAKRQNIAADTLFRSFARGQATIDKHEKTLTQLGVTYKDAAGNVRPLLAILEDVDDALVARNANQQLRLKTIFTMMGARGGDGMERLLAAGPLAGYEKRLREIGGILSDQDLRKAQLLADSIDDVTVAARGLTDQLVVALGPAVTEMLNSAATRMGQLPMQIRGLGTALRAVRGDGEGSEQGAQILSRLRQTSQEAIATSLIETAKLAGHTFALAVRTTLLLSLPAIAGTAERLLYQTINRFMDAVPDQVRKLVKWTPITSTPEARLAYLESIQQTAARRGPQVLALERAYRASSMSNSGAVQDASFFIANEALKDASAKRIPLTWTRQLDENTSETLNAVKDAKLLQKEIQQARIAIAREHEMMGRQMVSDIDTVFNPYIAALDDYKDKVSGAWGQVNSVLKELGTFQEKFGTTDAGPALPPAVDRMVINLQPTLENAKKMWATYRTNIETAMRMVSAAVDQGMAKQRELLRGANQLGEELAAKTLRVQGRTLEADLAELAILRRRELGDIAAKFGQFAPVEQTNAYFDQQRTRLLTDSRLASIVQELERVESRYNRTLEERGVLVETGTMRSRDAASLNRQQAAQVVKDLEMVERSLQNLQRSTPASMRGIFAEASANITEAKRLARSRQRELDPGEFSDGWERAFDRLEQQSRDMRAFGGDVAGSLIQSFGTDLPNALIDTIGGVRSAQDAFREFGASAARSLAQVAMQMLAIRAISGVMGLFGGVGGAATGASGIIGGTGGTFDWNAALPNAGGLIGWSARSMRGEDYIARSLRRTNFNSGGHVSVGSYANRDSVPAMLTRGEFVMNREGVNSVGASVLAAINGGSMRGRGASQRGDRGGGGGGGGGGGVNIHVTVNMPTMGGGGSGGGGGGGVAGVGGGGGGQSSTQVAAQVAAAVKQAVSQLTQRDAGFRATIAAAARGRS
jgi:hypothetical protein